MNIKEMVVIVGVALLATIAINHFFLSKSPIDTSSNNAGQSFVAPLNGQAVKPLALEVNFQGNEKENQLEMTTVTTDYATMKFSNHGAVLEHLEFKEHRDSNPTLITTIDSGIAKDRIQGAFLVAMPELTPYFYTLHDHHDNDDTAVLIYHARYGSGAIQKKFTIAKKICKIDLEVAIQPNGQATELRVLYPSPNMPSIAKDDVISALVLDQKGTLNKIQKKNIEPNQGWFKLNLFGTENKYFIHALVHDANAFVQRAYYKSVCNNLISIIEGPSIDQSTTWSLSFYMGPKSEEDILQVDKRLEGALEYSGLLAPLARLLLIILMFLNSYVHNYGWAIVAITLLIKLFLTPFTIRGQKSLKRQEEYQKKLNYIQQKYKNDPELLNQERAALIAKHGMPGMAGCLPLLLQLPIFIALQRVLSSSVELYKASFLWIPDLSMADPYYILPLIITLAMFFQAMWTPAAQRPMMLVSGILFGAFSATFSAGLALYLAVNMVFQYLQTVVTGKAS